MNNKTFIDLFCGCGGFSLGASLSGYKNILSVDVDPILTSSYKLNFPSSNLRLADLAKIDDIRTLLSDKSEKPDLLIGGPPCQGFSFIGKRNPNDPRNELIYHYFRHVKRLKPHFFILENVVGLSSGYGIDAIEEGKSLLPSYYNITDAIIIDANDFGAATNRSRVMIIGYDKRYNTLSDLEVLLKQRKEKPTVKDAILDLPSPKKFSEGSFDWVKYKTNIDISSYAKNLKTKPPKHLGWDFAIKKMEHGFVSGITATEHTEEVKQRFKQTTPGYTEKISRYFKLKWNEPSKTIRAGTGKDKGGFQAARPIHPTQSRVITVREAARIQGFPDWFVFHPTKWHSFRMIGNSVSPIMSKTIITKLKEVNS
jgi:DNA (cytosine-5)-methyltransferase 1